jgi:prepilin-type N-terminal cleavage/methylation domain-containing protein
MYNCKKNKKMLTLNNYLKNEKVQKVLSKKPGEEGFSLVELVIVIAVLAILAAVAIPAFQGVQARAKTSAVKNGLVNGVKECVVSSAMDLGETFDKSRAFAGSYTSYNVGPMDSSCYKAYAGAQKGSNLPDFWIQYNPQTGVSTKSCGPAAGNEGASVGCNLATNSW